MQKELYLILGLLCLSVGGFSLYNGDMSFASMSSGKSVTVNSAVIWNHTGISVVPGKTVNIKATGQINVGSPGDGSDKWVGPDGWGNIPAFTCNGKPCLYKYAVSDSLGSLIGKIGTNGRPFHVGTSTTVNASESGELLLGVNDGISDWNGRILSESELLSLMYFNNRGTFNATVEVK